MAGEPIPNLPPQPAAPPHPEASQELDALKAQARDVEAQLAVLNDQIVRIGQAAASPRLVAVVDDQRCLGCGRCIQACPVVAITLNAVAAIDPGKCTACGQCVVVCPQGAVVLRAWRG
jgi:ferredoxin